MSSSATMHGNFCHLLINFTFQHQSFKASCTHSYVHPQTNAGTTLFEPQVFAQSSSKILVPLRLMHSGIVNLRNLCLPLRLKTTLYAPYVALTLNALEVLKCALASEGSFCCAIKNSRWEWLL